MASLLAPLSKSKFTVRNTKGFFKYIQKQKVPDGYKMVSFDGDQSLDSQIIIKKLYFHLVQEWKEHNFW